MVSDSVNISRRGREVHYPGSGSDDRGNGDVAFASSWCEDRNENDGPLGVGLVHPRTRGHR